jgi:tape measure domain-containing protein
VSTAYQVDLVFGSGRSNSALQALEARLRRVEQIAAGAGQDPFRPMADGAGRAGRAVDDVGGSLGRLAGQIAVVIGAGKLLNDVFSVGLTNAQQRVRIEALAQGYDRYDQVLNQAIKSGARFNLSQNESLAGFAQIYGRLRPLGLGVQQITAAYEGFNTAATLSGATAGESKGAFLQLSQALGAGALRGEELNSVLEQAPLLGAAIAKQLGITRGELKAYAEQGKLTSGVVIAALEDINRTGADKLAKLLNTPEQKLKRFGNAWEKLQLVVAGQVLPAIIAGVEAATRTLEGFEKIPAGIRDPILAIGTAALAATVGVGALGTAVSLLGGAFSALSLGAALPAIIAAGPWLAAAAGVIALTKAAYDLNAPFREFVDTYPQRFAAFWGSLYQQGRAALQQVQYEVVVVRDFAVATLTFVGNAAKALFGNIPRDAQRLLVGLQPIFKGFQDGFAATFDFVRSSWVGTVGQMLSDALPLIGVLNRLTGGLIKAGSVAQNVAAGSQMGTQGKVWGPGTFVAQPNGFEKTPDIVGGKVGLSNLMPPPAPAAASAGGATRQPKAPSYPASITRMQFIQWMRTQGFERTSGDFTNAGHRTPNHMVNAIDMGWMTGTTAQAHAKTAAMERKLRATGAFGGQLFGPLNDPAGHGNGDNVHLHIPSPGGRIKMNPQLAKLMGLGGGAGGMGMEEAGWENQIAEQAARQEEQRKKQFEASTKNFAMAQANYKIQQATTEEAKLQATADRDRLAINQRFDELVANSASAAETEVLNKTRGVELAGVDLKLQQDLNKVLEDRAQKRAAVLAQMEAAIADKRAQLAGPGAVRALERGRYVEEAGKSGVDAETAGGLFDQNEQLDVAIAKQQQMKALYEEIGATIANNLGGAIQGLIDGSKSLNDVLSETLASLASILQQQALTGIAKGISGGLGGIFGFAGGGPVKKGQPIVVGDNPDGSLNPTSELFVPDEAGRILSAAETRQTLALPYLTARGGGGGGSSAAGQAYGTPGGRGGYSGGRGGLGGDDAPLPVAPIDIRYEATDSPTPGVRYVTESQFLAGMDAVSKRTQANTLASIKNNPTTRRTAGIR